jgi:hypothetical protein
MNLSFDLPLGVDGRINLTNESKVRILSNGIGGKMVPTYMLTATDAQREEYTYKMLHRERHDQLLRGLGLIQ